MKIGDQIKAAREGAGLTQLQLADKMKVTPQNISQYERNKKNPKPDTIKKIADALEVSIDYLLNCAYKPKVKIATREDFNNRENDITEKLLKDATTQCAIDTITKMYKRSEVDCQNYLGELAKVSAELEQVKRERDAAIKDIERNLKGMDTHSCQMCVYYKDCKRNIAECAHDAKWRGVRED